MTDPATLLDLADRCEQAAGPDRELDIAIAAGLGWPDGRYSPPILPFERVRLPRHYTDSLDTAAALVPDGWAVELVQALSGSPWHATLRGGSALVPIIGATASKPALALCAAALRARYVKP